MGSSSRELLHLERKNFSTTSSLESALLVCNKKDSESLAKKPDGKAVTCPISNSQVLGKVKDFLGVISEANKRLQQDAEDNSKNYDIEVLTGNESDVIEMDLMLGIADLHTPEAIAAAESAVSNRQPLVSVDPDSSESESESTSDDDDNSESGSDIDNEDEACYSLKGKKSKFGKDGSSEALENSGSKKRAKIVEM